MNVVSYIENGYYFIDDDDEIWKGLENDGIITLDETKRSCECLEC